jgi:type IV pilus assembly protein PilQ
MKYTTRLHSLFILLLILVLGCSSKKDLIDEQSLSEPTHENHADNKTISTEENGKTNQNSITDIRMTEEREGANVYINLMSKPNYTIFKLSNPDRIIIDIPDITSEDSLKELKPQNDLISTIRSSLMSDTELKYLRVEILTKKVITYSAESHENTIVVSIKNKEFSHTERAVEKNVQSDYAQLISAINQNIGKGNLIKLQLLKTIPHFSSYKLANPARLVIELDNAQNEIRSGVVNINENYVNKIRLGQNGKSLKVVFDMNGNEVPDFEIRQSAPNIIVALGAEALAVKNGQPLPEKPIAEKKAPNEITTQPPVQEKKPAASSNQYGELIYTGEKISLDFKDADLKNVLRLLGEIGGINMTIGDKVAGRVTLKLENIPCDEALDIVLINNGLDKTVTPQYTRIDTADQIKKFNDERILAKKSHEQSEDLTIKTFSISYAKASTLAKFIKEMDVLTKGRGSVNYFDLTNKLSVSDIPSVIAKVQGIINEQDIPTRQVMIESKVVQSSPNWVRDLGIRWGGTHTATASNGNTKIPISGAQPGTTDSVVDLLSASNAAINIGYISDKYNLDMTLTAQENEDKVKILSNPRLLTLDNKEASIKQGVQIPYPKLNENGVTSTEFKDAVLEMKVTPKITAANTISITVDVKKDQVSAQTGVGGEPGIDVRQIKTELLVESGKTVVIGGIYETTKTKNVKSVPILGKIPLIRWLFTNVHEQDQLTEMLVFITVTVIESPKMSTTELKDSKS